MNYYYNHIKRVLWPFFLYWAICSVWRYNEFTLLIHWRLSVCVFCWLDHCRTPFQHCSISSFGEQKWFCILFIVYFINKDPCLNLIEKFKVSNVDVFRTLSRITIRWFVSFLSNITLFNWSFLMILMNIVFLIPDEKIKLSIFKTLCRVKNPEVLI